MPFSRDRRPLSLCAVALCLVFHPAFAQTEAPALLARSAVLMEARTGAIIFQNNAEEPLEPASLTKLMTLSLVLDAISAGEVNPTQEIVPSPEAWARNQPAHSSVMFLGPNQKLTINELLQGLIVDSGNDAAVELAIRVSGSERNFVDLMNAKAAEMGYSSFHFTDPAGIDDGNRVGARDLADFCRRFLSLYPDTLQNLFSVRELTYPRPENVTQGSHDVPITQNNRNELLGHYDGVDGLKTGFTDAAGYNMAVTAQRNGMRLIGVLLGIPGNSTAEGSRRRLAETKSLLDYGFTNFADATAPELEMKPVKVWKGTARSVAIAVRPEPVVLVRKSDVDRLRSTLHIPNSVTAPVVNGQQLGEFVVTVDGKVVDRFPVVATAAVGRGNIFRRAIDSIKMLLGL